MRPEDSKTIKNAVLGALVAMAFGGGYWFIADHFALSALVQAQGEYVQRDVLEITLEQMKDDIKETKDISRENKDRSESTDKNVLLIMGALKVKPGDL